MLPKVLFLRSTQYSRPWIIHCSCERTIQYVCHCTGDEDPKGEKFRLWVTPEQQDSARRKRKWDPGVRNVVCLDWRVLDQPQCAGSESFPNSFPQSSEPSDDVLEHRKFLEPSYPSEGLISYVFFLFAHDRPPLLPNDSIKHIFAHLVKTNYNVINEMDEEL